MMAMVSGQGTLQRIGSLQVHLPPGSQYLSLQQQQLLLTSSASFSVNGHVIANWRSSKGVKQYLGRKRGAESKRSGGVQRFLLHCSQAEAMVRSQMPMKFTHEGFEGFLLSMEDTICATAAEADGIGRNFGEDRWQRGKDPSSGYGITRVMEDGNLLEKAAVNVSIVRGQLSESRAKVEGGGAWFGGGADLTPAWWGHLARKRIGTRFRFVKEVPEGFMPSIYPLLRNGGGYRDKAFSFVKEVPEGFMPSIYPLLSNGGV